MCFHYLLFRICIFDGHNTGITQEKSRSPEGKSAVRRREKRTRGALFVFLPGLNGAQKNACPTKVRQAHQNKTKNQL